MNVLLQLMTHVKEYSEVDAFSALAMTPEDAELMSFNIASSSSLNIEAETLESFILVDETLSANVASILPLLKRKASAI